MKHTCQITHPQIVSGVCPWCQDVIGDRDVEPTSAVTVWNIPAMLIALTDPDEDVRSITMTNLYQDGLTIDEIVPLISQVLSDSSDHIRSLAEGGLTHRGRRLAHDEAPQFEARIPGAEHELALRILLLGHYFLRQHESESVCAARHEHIS